MEWFFFIEFNFVKNEIVIVNYPWKQAFCRFGRYLSLLTFIGFLSILIFQFLNSPLSSILKHKFLVGKDYILSEKPAFIGFPVFLGFDFCITDFRILDSPLILIFSRFGLFKLLKTGFYRLSGFYRF